jgi:predicted nucleic acid-binding protein
LECRVKPIRDGNLALLHDYDDYFTNAVSEIVPLTRVVLDHATEIRARFKFKTPDAIHLAAAVASGCDAFLTNDHRLDSFSQLKIVILQP